MKFIPETYLMKVIPESTWYYSRNVPDEGYSRNASCALHLISMFLYHESDMKWNLWNTNSAISWWLVILAEETESVHQDQNNNYYLINIVSCHFHKHRWIIYFILCWYLINVVSSYPAHDEVQEIIVFVILQKHP
jgi:hypothetical protein